MYFFVTNHSAVTNTSRQWGNIVIVLKRIHALNWKQQVFCLDEQRMVVKQMRMSGLSVECHELMYYVVSGYMNVGYSTVLVGCVSWAHVLCICSEWLHDCGLFNCTWGVSTVNTLICFLHCAGSVRELQLLYMNDITCIYEGNLLLSCS